jgi:hypothetical protein
MIDYVPENLISFELRSKTYNPKYTIDIKRHI